ncbi:MAG: hypothetical protein J7L10_03025 [Methanomicrobia archaeon]|nr:hypothetical protein [Methanomicrobia archaeon]RLF92347.1 MAG: hypothetical protein DRN50_09090 [Thermococci archaeon]
MGYNEEDLEEIDRKNIRREMEAVGLNIDEEYVEKVRIAMLKGIMLKTVAKAALIPKDAEEKEEKLLEAIYTNVLACLLNEKK